MMIIQRSSFEINEGQNIPRKDFLSDREVSMI